jgi:hypothetical protein
VGRKRNMAMTAHGKTEGVKPPFVILDGSNGIILNMRDNGSGSEGTVTHCPSLLGHKRPICHERRSPSSIHIAHSLRWRILWKLSVFSFT